MTLRSTPSRREIVLLAATARSLSASVQALAEDEYGADRDVLVATAASLETIADMVLASARKREDIIRSAIEEACDLVSAWDD